MPLEEIELGKWDQISWKNEPSTIYNEGYHLLLSTHRLIIRGGKDIENRGMQDALVIQMDDILEVDFKQPIFGSPKAILSWKQIVPIQESAEWKCQLCNHQNGSDVPKCALCGLKKPDTPESTTKWHCSVCSFENETPGRCKSCGINQGAPPSTRRPQEGTEGRRLTTRILFVNTTGFNSFKTALRNAHQNIQNCSSTTTTTKEGSARLTKDVVGVTGIVRHAEEVQAQQHSNLQDAFQDIEHLMLKASQMVHLAEKITSRLHKREEDNLSQTEEDQFQRVVASLGITGILTRDTTGSAYYVELAQQLAEMAMKLMKLRKIEVMPVTDLFCFYNRTRGTALCSPRDFIDAIQIYWPKTQVSSVLCRSLGKVLVIQSSSYSDQAIIQRIQVALQKNSFLTALQWSELTALPLILATESLLMAERGGVLARDATLHGSHFYRNLILHPDD